MGTAIVGLIVLCVVILVIKYMAKKKSKGSPVTGCSGNCAHCGGNCH